MTAHAHTSQVTVLSRIASDSEDTPLQWSDRCPECGGPVDSHDATERVCRDCDLVLQDAPPCRRRERVFDDHDWRSKRRTGGRQTALRVDRGIGAGVGWGIRDANGNVLSPSQRSRVRTGFWGNTIDTGRLGYALSELERVGNDLAVPTPERETAARLYRRASDAGIVRGRTIEGFVCASLLVAVRGSNVTLPITVEDLLERSRAERVEEIRNAQRALVREFDEVALTPARPQDYVVRIADSVEVSADAIRMARQFLEIYQRKEGKYRGTNPVVTAAVSLHAAFDMLEIEDRPTLSDLGRAADVHPTTISDRKSGFIETVS